MDCVSYDGFQKRLQLLETLLVPSGVVDVLPVVEQVENLGKLINDNTGSEFKCLFQLLKDNHLWEKISVWRSEVVDEYSEVHRNFVIANAERLLEFLKNVEEVISLAEQMNLLIKTASPHYTEVLSVQFPTERYNHMVRNYSKLLVRSMLLLERNCKFLIKENEFWVSKESKLIQLEKQVNSLTEKHKRDTMYT